MKPIHWLFLITLAFIIGWHLKSIFASMEAVTLRVGKMHTRISDFEQRLMVQEQRIAQHEARWSWINRVVDMGRKAVSWVW